MRKQIGEQGQRKRWGKDSGERTTPRKERCSTSELHTLVDAAGLEPATVFLRRKRWLHHRNTGARERAKPESHREGGRGFEPQQDMSCLSEVSDFLTTGEKGLGTSEHRVWVDLQSKKRSSSPQA